MCGQRSRDLSGAAQYVQVCDIKVSREQTDPMLSNGSRDTLMSYVDHSMQRLLIEGLASDV